MVKIEIEWCPETKVLSGNRGVEMVMAENRPLEGCYWLVVDGHWHGWKKLRVRQSGKCQVFHGGMLLNDAELVAGETSVGEPVEFVLARSRNSNPAPAEVPDHPKVFPLPSPLRRETLEADLKAYVPSKDQDTSTRGWAEHFGWIIPGLPWGEQPCRKAAFRFKEMRDAPLRQWRASKLEDLLPLVCFPNEEPEFE